MDIFYPFIHEKKEKNGPIPLYVELVLPVLEKQEDISEEKEEPGFIIIELF